jgi:hypothetical protein
MSFDDLNLILDAIGKFLTLLIDKLGVGQTIALLVVVYLLLVVRRLYLDYRKDKDSDRAIKAMETSVQRSAQEAREWRILFMKEKAGWSLEEAERMVMSVDFEDPASARNALEKKGGKRSEKTGRRRRK